MKRMRWLALIAIFSLFAVACSAAEEAADTVTDAADDVADEVAGDDGDDGGDDGDDAGADDDDAGAEEDAGDDADDGASGVVEATTDFGANDEVIRVGLNADLTGPFSSLTTVIVAAQQAYFDRVNENGGIGGRMVELIDVDTAYDVPTHIDNYAEFAEESEDGVVMLSQSTGSPQTTAIAQDLIDDNIIAVPLTWYSGWAFDNGLGNNVFELSSNYCFEGMNGVEFLAQQSPVAAPTLAIISLPGEYGQDSAAGARIAAEALSLDIVADLEGAIAGEDFAPIVSQLLEQQPDIVWIASTPGQLGEIMGTAVAGGLQAIWSGALPSYNPALIADGSPVAPAFDALYFPSAFQAPWDSNDSALMQDMVSELTARLGDFTFAQADSLARGWLEAMFTEAVLIQATENGDLTRAGVVAAANQVEISFEGIAPNQTWGGDPNDFAIRSSSFSDINIADATLASTISEGGSTGLTTLVEDFVGDVAGGHEFNEPCFVSAG